MERLRTRPLQPKFLTSSTAAPAHGAPADQGLWLEDREMAQGIVPREVQALDVAARVTAWVRSSRAADAKFDVESAAQPPGGAEPQAAAFRGLLANSTTLFLGENPFHPDFR